MAAVAAGALSKVVSVWRELKGLVVLGAIADMSVVNPSFLRKGFYFESVFVWWYLSSFTSYFPDCPKGLFSHWMASIGNSIARNF